MNDGFSVDLRELADVARELRAVGDDVRGAAVWRYEVDVERLPGTDPLRAAVARYQNSLRAAVERLCGGTDRMAAAVDDTGAEYRRAEEEVATTLRRIADGSGGRGV